MNDEFFNCPRLYVDADLGPGTRVAPAEKQAHYLKNVLRMRSGEELRVFNGRQGEFLARFEGTGKTATLRLQKQIKEQPAAPAPVHLLFAPLRKKDRLDFLIEKAVELGVTDLHPVITSRTEMRKLNEERLRAQIFEAAEQCERFEIPALHPPESLQAKISGWREPEILWCCERGDLPPVSAIQAKSWAFLIGPEGGFDDKEFAFLGTRPGIKPVTLGEAVLRAETAALLALGYAKIQGKK